jgi:hypothetical protein
MTGKGDRAMHSEKLRRPNIYSGAVYVDIGSIDRIPIIARREQSERLHSRWKRPSERMTAHMK